MPRHCAAVGAILTAFALVFTLTASTASAATPQTSQANAALRYLYGQVGSDGGVAGAMGATEDTVISTADSGYDPATLKNASGKSAYDYLSAHASAITTAGGAAKYVLAWVAAGRPAAIDATSVLTKLNTPTGGGGYLGSNGAFHNSDPTVETANAFSQALAVLADVAAGHALPANASGWLVCAQRPDGGFGYVINDATATPPAFCGDTSSDTNDSGIVLQALGAAGVTSANSAAITYLHSAQQSDGGFSFGTTGSSDPDSDATVIQALLAIGEDPSAASWTVGGHQPIANLESFADPHGSGGYVFPGNAAPDAFTTSGLPQALALKPYASATTVAPGTSPPAPVAASTPTPTASPSATAGSIPVPATGAGGGGPVPAGLLVLLGIGAILTAVVRGRRAPAP
jgi:hypothetical protein